MASVMRKFLFIQLGAVLFFSVLISGQYAPGDIPYNDCGGKF